MTLRKSGQIITVILLLNVAQVINTKVFLLFPKGFSISVDNQSDIVDVHFDVNLTKAEENQTPSYYTKHVRHSFANAWTFVKRTVILDAGDTISYKTTINKDKPDETIENGDCQITELPKLGALRKHGWTFNYDVLLNCTSYDNVKRSRATPKALVSEAEEDMKTKLSECQKIAFNSSLTLLIQEAEIEELRNLTQQLRDFEEKYPLSKQLTLAGRIPPDGEPVETVSFMLYEKLDLKPTIVSAFRESTYSIKFTVSTIIEKFEIIQVAKYVLANTKITIE